MNTPVLSLEHLEEIYKPEQDWLFDKLLWKLVSCNNLILIADQGWGIQDYVNELRFQLAEKHPEVQTCYLDIRPAHSSTSFLELLISALLNQFPKETSFLDLDITSTNILSVPEKISRKHKTRIALFIANAHLIKRYKDSLSFLRTLKSKLRYSKNCVYCISGNNTPFFNKVSYSPGPLSGLGQLYELTHNPVKHRSASIRKMFHDSNKRIGYNTSVRMSFTVDNNPFYLKLLVWHSLLMTHNTCTTSVLDKSLNNLVQHFDHRFVLLVESLTIKQISFLKALQKGCQKMYSGSIREKYQLGSTSNVAKIIANLETRSIIITGRMGIEFTDPIFREWLRRRFFTRY